MKKNIYLYSIIMFIILMSPLLVYATNKNHGGNYPYTTPAGDNCIQNGTCIVACDYGNLKIYYDFGFNGWILSGYGHERCQGRDCISYDEYYHIRVSVKNNSEFGKTIEDDGDLLWESGITPSNFVCPKYGYVDKSGYDLICFDNYENNNKEACRKKEADSWSRTFTQYGLISSFENKISDIYDRAVNETGNKYEYTDGSIKPETCSKFLSEDTANQIEEEILITANNLHNQYLKEYFLGNDIPTFVKNNNLYKGKIEHIKTISTSIREQCLEEGVLSEEEKEFADTIFEENEDHLDDLAQEIHDKIVINKPIIGSISSCKSILGSPDVEKTPAWYLSIVFSIIRYVSIILLIVLSVMDFIGAIASQDNDIIKKAVNKLMRRAILCVVIFLLPTILDFGLQFLHKSQIQDCINLNS